MKLHSPELWREERNFNLLNTFTLKNGIKVVTYSIPHMRSAFFSTVVKAGSLFDTEKTSGTAHFMEHILVQGIPSYPNIEILNKFIESIAGTYNASTSRELIRFYVNAPATHLDDLVKIGSETFFEPLFPEDSIDREKSAITSEIKRRADETSRKNYVFTSKTRYKKGHPLTFDGVGDEKVIAKLKRKDLLNYWKRFFIPKNTYIVLVGGFENNNARRIIEKYFNKYNSKQTFPDYPKFNNDDMTGRTTAIRYDQDLQNCYVTINFPSTPYQVALKKRATQSIISSILGGLQTSRLNNLLRWQRGLVYGVSVGAFQVGYSGEFAIYSEAAVDKLEEVLDLIKREIKSLVDNGPTPDELDFAKEYRKNRVMMSFDHPDNIADWIEGDLIWEDKMYTPEEMADIYDSITMEDVNKFLRSEWDLSRLNLVIQGPIKNTKENIKKYSKLVEELK